MTLFADTLAVLQHAQPAAASGCVAQVQGLAVHVADLNLPIGAVVSMEAQAASIEGEVVGFDTDRVIVAPLGPTRGVRRGDRVTAVASAALARVGPGLLGRVVNGRGDPIDGRGPLVNTVRRPLRPGPIPALDRRPVSRALSTGVRAIDAMLPVGHGQRLGIFSGSGVGKSTLLGMITAHAAVDVTIVALIGERGREVGDFIEHHLGEAGMARSVVVAASADEPALMRIRAAWLACAAAEYFRDQGLDVALIMDSVTRFAQSQRQVGLAAGEPPASRGYPPSAFSAIPDLLERSGCTAAGSITGFYAVLVEGDDLSEPIADACRSALDGHIVLDRPLAEAGHYPAIDVTASVSRLAGQIMDEPHRLARDQIVRLINAFRQAEDLLRVGAYVSGSDPLIDVAVEMKPSIEQVLRQAPGEGSAPQDTRRELLRIATDAARLTVRRHRRAVTV
jgi:flagellum-specific ATP synthase